MKHTIPKEQLLSVSLPILQGLLSSGHFTSAQDPDLELSEPSALTFDVGKEWKNEGEGNFSKRHPSFAVITALELAAELIEQIEKDVDKSDLTTIHT